MKTTRTNMTSEEFKTYGDVYDSACKVRSVNSASSFLHRYASWIFEKSEDHISMKRAMEIARGNIGYLLGYGAPRRVIEIWEKVKAHHPVLGQLSKLDKSPEEIVEMGATAAKKVAGRRK